MNLHLYQLEFKINHLNFNANIKPHLGATAIRISSHTTIPQKSTMTVSPRLILNTLHYHFHQSHITDIA